MRYIQQHKSIFLFSILFVIFLFFRFYLLIERANFGWDQIDSAWAVKSILVDKHILINGPVAKGNSGIYMGPLYFYLITPFYFFTKLDPIASPLFQGVMSIVNFIVLFIVTKKLFNTKIAFIAAFINVFSIYSIAADKVQSDYYLIVPISYLIFYALYNLAVKNERYVFLLAIFLGLSFHIDFTSIFYPIIILFSLPFLPRTKKMVIFTFLSIPLFLLFLLPSIISDLLVKHAVSGSVMNLFHSSYHGIHLRRLLQILSDAFISFGEVLWFAAFKYAQYLVFPLFIFLYYKQYSTKQSLILFYFMSLWIVIPWIVLSAYNGELTNYYFSLPFDLAIGMLAYITYYILQQKNLLIKFVPILFWVLYAYSGLVYFWTMPNGNLLGYELDVKRIVREGKYIPFKDHNADSYLYYVYTRKKYKS